MSKRIGLFLIGILFLACAGSPRTPAWSASALTTADGSDQLDIAIRETSDYLNKYLPKGNKLVIPNVQSEFPALSEYIIDELIANTVNDRFFSVVDRRQLDTIRAELDFQMSGEVDDETAQALGRMTGAQIIVSSAVSKIGDIYRLRVRALSVQTAQIEGQFNRNIPNGPTVAALVRSQATGYGGGMTTAVTKPGMATQVAPSATPTPNPAPPPAPTTYKIYKIGDTGPAGGIIFHDKKVFSNGWRYLEALPVEMEFTAQWGTEGQDVKTETAVGTGKRNSQLIVEALKRMRQNDRAAELCVSLEFSGYKDWFLPSIDELDLMYKNLKQEGGGGFGDGWYWSSSQYDYNGYGDYHNYARGQNFSDGANGISPSYAIKHLSRDNALSVRAIRQF